MYWNTNHDNYGSFHPKWQRSYLTKLPELEREKTRISMNQRVATTQNEYGQWYSTCKAMPRGAFTAREPYPYTRNTEPVFFPKPWTPARSVPPTVRTPMIGGMHTPRLPPLHDAFQRDSFNRELLASRASRTGYTERGQQQAILCLPEVRGVDVQILTADNNFISVAPQSSRVEKTSYPHTLQDIAMPNIKEINVKFCMDGDKTVGVRAIPIPDAE